MKEASGEASMTVIAIILIGVIAAVATPIVRNAMTNTGNQADCLTQGLCSDGNGGCTECNGI